MEKPASLAEAVAQRARKHHDAGEFEEAIELYALATDMERLHADALRAQVPEDMGAAELRARIDAIREMARELIGDQEAE